MISVLIPVFNRDVNELVNLLSCQVALFDKEVEIVVMDDGSEATYKNLNSTLAGKSFVRYIDAGKNNGRVRIRQMLADEASYDWLLFLDCDSVIISDQFLQTYHENIFDQVSAIVGGRIYTSVKPNDNQLMLHWRYGSVREVSRFDDHNHPGRFMTNNFFIRKSIFKRFDFGDQWNRYGYEDTWMGIQLEAMRFPVIFINNPVLHDGLETSAVFITKSEEALKNLKRLSNVIPDNVLMKHVKLYDYYCKLRYRKLLWITRAIYFTFKKIIRKNLHSGKPSLVLFDLYRLGYFTNENAKTIDS